MAMDYQFDDVNELKESAYQAVLCLFLQSAYNATKGAVLTILRQELEIPNERHLSMMSETKAKGIQAFPQFPQQEYDAGGSKGSKARRPASDSGARQPKTGGSGKKTKPPGTSWLDQGPESMLLRKVKRNWNEMGWFEGVVTDYDAASNQYCITYDLFKGQDEQMETINLASLTEGEHYIITDETINPRSVGQSKLEESRAFLNSSMLAPRFLTSSPYKGPKRKSKGSLD